MPRSSFHDDRFLIEPFEPAYLSLIRAGELPGRIAAALRASSAKAGEPARVAGAFPHRGGEECLRGRAGSGRIFFSPCNVACVFCRNWDITQRAAGSEVTPNWIAQRMLDLQAQGCPTITLVTPDHFLPQILEATGTAAAGGLRLPLVYMTSTYVSVESLRALDGIVDIYLPEFLFWDEATALRLGGVADYPPRAREAIREMHRQVGPLRFGPDGLARRGLLVRHLVMPGQLDQTREMFRWLAREISPDTYLHVLGQYRPHHLVGTTDPEGGSRYEEINRPTSPRELAEAWRLAREAGLWRLEIPWAP